MVSGPSWCPARVAAEQVGQVAPRASSAGADLQALGCCRLPLLQGLWGIKFKLPAFITGKKK